MLLGSWAAFASAASGQDGSAHQPQALERAGIYALRQADPNLTGAGVRFGVICRSSTYNEEGEPQNDYQPNVRHNCFQNARLSFYDDHSLAPGVSAHSTAICSILFGEDPKGIASELAPFLYEGAVPAAEGHIYEFWHFAKKLPELTQDGAARKRPVVDVATASFGWPLEDWWTRGIETLIDRDGLVVVASIGNGSNASNPPFYPGAGPNAIGVGVVSSVNATDAATRLAYFALAYPEESSTGPTEDGRCKPDVIAPGNCLVGQADSSEGYTMAGNWSSFSTPVAAGVVGLLVQAARQDVRLSPAVSPKGGTCVLKAILMDSAVKLPYWHKGRLSTDDDHEVPLDYVQGAGMVDAVRAYHLLKAGPGKPGDVPAAGWDLNQLTAGQTAPQVYRFVVEEPGNKMLTATLVWNRHYRESCPFQHLAESDSDLRLEVWAVDPANADNNVLVDYSDSRVDNVEHVYVATVADRTLYELIVSYSTGEGRPGAAANERYALAWAVAEKRPENDILWHDLNADGVVDELDFAIVLNNAGVKTPEGYVIGDIDMDGDIDTDDMAALFAHRNEKAEWHTEQATN
jgi:hypothetical protein